MKFYRNTWFVIGRILVGLFYILTGGNHFLNLEASVVYAANMGVPFPTIAVIISGLLLLLAGITFVLGLRPWFGIVALVLFFVPVSIMMHPFWRMNGPQAQTEMVNFLKNMGLLGSTLCFVGISRPWPVSLDAKLSGTSPASEQRAESK